MTPSSAPPDVLHEALAGKVLTRSDFRVPAFATLDLVGRTVDEVVPRGKHLLHRIGDLTVHSHLKMEAGGTSTPPGALAGDPPGTAWSLDAADVSTVGFTLGVLEVVPRDQESEVVGHLGPDLLGPDWDADVALANLTADPERPIGLALLDQRVLAGLGNVYRNELCFLRGVLPTRPGRPGAGPGAGDRARQPAHHDEPRPEPPRDHGRGPPGAAVLGLRPGGQAVPPLRHAGAAR